VTLALGLTAVSVVFLKGAREAHAARHCTDWYRMRGQMLWPCLAVSGGLLVAAGGVAALQLA